MLRQVFRRFAILIFSALFAAVCLYLFDNTIEGAIAEAFFKFGRNPPEFVSSPWFIPIFIAAMFAISVIYILANLDNRAAKLNFNSSRNFKMFRFKDRDHPIFTVTIRNTGGSDLDNCLVRLCSAVNEVGLGINGVPFVLRTENQIRGGRLGPFNLRVGEEKDVPVFAIASEEIGQVLKFFEENEDEYWLVMNQSMGRWVMLRFGAFGAGPPRYRTLIASLNQNRGLIVRPAWALDHIWRRRSIGLVRRALRVFRNRLRR